ncbi:MAG: hypothetical protein K8W52_15615, partial [Deltaproteobacteria bacterium]|nr:hypothetical protein [Deltaproteobacteria bacterium]
MSRTSSWLCALVAIAGCGKSDGGASGSAASGSAVASGAAGSAVASGAAAAPGSAEATASPAAASAPPATGDASACAALGSAKFGALMVAMMRGNLAPTSPEVARMDAHRAALETSINAAMVPACTRDAWSASAAACIAKATTSAELDPCEKELGADQTAKLGEVL